MMTSPPNLVTRYRFAVLREADQESSIMRLENVWDKISQAKKVLLAL
jgi:hypothetical protein